MKLVNKLVNLSFDDVINAVRANPTKYVFRRKCWTNGTVASCNVSDNYTLYIETNYSTSRLLVTINERRAHDWMLIPL